ncbi:MAG: citrate synthase [Acidobacteriota bacterium]
MATTVAPETKAPEGATKMRESLTITDNRTGKAYDLPIKDGTIRAIDLRQIKEQPTDFGLMTYDPAFLNTASCKSTITFIDGDKGILNYRGYPIAELAEKTTYLETAYLVVNGELPTKTQYDSWTNDITFHTMVHENIKGLMKGFRYDAHPMGMLASTVSALSTFYPEAKEVREPETRRQQIIRLIAKIPTLAAFAYRHSIGWPFSYPDNELSYTANFLQMMYRAVEPKYVANPTLVKALEILFILHADHEQNCSTNAMRAIGSSEADPYVSAAGAIGALYGPLHGGANEAVLRMLFEIGSKSKIPEFIKSVKESGGETKLMGFGHRVYKNYDPRAKVIKNMAEQVFEVTGKNPLLDIALELERIALQDEYFLKRKLYPNVDFYSGLIYQAMKFPVDMFPVLFAIPRMSGWLAQWNEMMADNDQKIARPRQIYLGSGERHIVPFEKR